MIESKTRDSMIAAVQEFTDAKAKPSVASLAKAHGVHAQQLTGALLVYGLVDEPRARKSARLGTAVEASEAAEEA